MQVEDNRHGRTRGIPGMETRDVTHVGESERAECLGREHRGLGVGNRAGVLAAFRCRFPLNPDLSEAQLPPCQNVRSMFRCRSLVLLGKASAATEKLRPP